MENLSFELDETLNLENLLCIIKANKLECEQCHAHQNQQQQLLEADQKGLRVYFENLKSQAFTVN